jgi:hypothetical protein
MRETTSKDPNMQNENMLISLSAKSEERNIIFFLRNQGEDMYRCTLAKKKQ